MTPWGLEHFVITLLILLVYGALIVAAYLLIRAVIRISVAAMSIAESLKRIADRTPPPQPPSSENE